MAKQLRLLASRLPQGTSHSHARPAAFVVAVLGIATACSGPDESSEAQTGGQASAIYNVFTLDTRYTAVGGLNFSDGGCTATLITPHVALTAAHCVYKFAHGCQTQLQEVRDVITFRYRPSGVDTDAAAETVYAVDGVSTFPKPYEPRAATCGTCATLDGTPHPIPHPWWDMALVHLKDPVAGVPMPVITQFMSSAPASWAGNPQRVTGARHVVLPTETSFGPLSPARPVVCGYGARTPGAPSGRKAGFAHFDLGSTWASSYQNEEDCQANQTQRLVDYIHVTADFGGAVMGAGDSGGPLIVLESTDPSGYGVPGLFGGPFVIGTASESDSVLNMYYAPTFGSETGPWLEKRLQDFDLDGVPDRQDNCVVAYNPGQENCNELAETKNNLPVLGDACDPVPCSRMEVVTTKQGTPNCVSIPNSGWQECSQTYRLDKIKATTRPSHAIDSARGPTEPEVATNVSAVDTHTRFCQEAPWRTPPVRCDRDIVIKDAQLTVWASASAEVGTETDKVYHRIKYGLSGSAATRGNPLTGWTYGTTAETDEWAYADDVTFWLGSSPPIIPMPPGNSTCSDANLATPCPRGLLWLHAATSVGTSEHGSDLANSYFPIERPRNDVSYCLLSNPLYASPSPPLYAVPLGRPIAWHPNAKPLYKPENPRIPTRPVDQGGLADTALLVHVTSASALFDTALAAVQDDGTALVAPHSVLAAHECGGAATTPSVGTLANQKVWLSAVEPSVRINPLLPPWTAASISPDGQQLLGYADADDGRLRASQALILAARRTYSPSATIDAVQDLNGHALVRIPSELPLIEGSAANQTATLTFTQSTGSVSCTYQGSASSLHPTLQEEDLGLVYAFQSCTGGVVPGDVLDATNVSVHIDGGDDREPTAVRVTLAASELDYGGFGVTAYNPGGSSPPARSAPVAFFSRAAAGVFVGGGVNPSSNADLHDMWFRPIDGSWQQVTLDPPVGPTLCGATGSGVNDAIGKIISATFSFADQRLWMLDSVESDTIVRLLRMAKLGGTVEVVASWSKTASGVDPIRRTDS